MAKMILQNINKETGEILEAAKFRTKYDAHHKKQVEHYDSEYMLDDTGYTPLKVLVERCIIMGNNPFNKKPDYQADIEVSEDDFMSDDFEDKLDNFDESIENPQPVPPSPVVTQGDVQAPRSDVVDNFTGSTSEANTTV